VIARVMWIAVVFLVMGIIIGGTVPEASCAP
jgi:hypothetical protein